MPIYSKPQNNYPNLSKPFKFYPNISKPVTKTYPSVFKTIQTPLNLSKPIKPAQTNQTCINIYNSIQTVSKHIQTPETYTKLYKPYPSLFETIKNYKNLPNYNPAYPKTNTIPIPTYQNMSKLILSYRNLSKPLQPIQTYSQFKNTHLLVLCTCFCIGVSSFRIQDFIFKINDLGLTLS